MAEHGRKYWKVWEMAGLADMAGNFQKWLEITENEWNGWEWLELADQKDLNGNGRKDKNYLTVWEMA